MNIVPDNFDRELVTRLDQVEAEHGVTIIFACESGSRAWGFASPDSDFDIRFIYLRPAAWYLSIDLEARRDVVEQPIQGIWDVNGWDLRKALQLLRKSNPPLLEWLHSPIVYRQHETLADELRALAGECYSPRACLHHHLSMAKNNARALWQTKSIKRKKYLYVLRSLLAARWIECMDGVSPVEFDRLVKATVHDDNLVQAINDLVEEKKEVREMQEGPPILVIHSFVESELDRHQRNTISQSAPKVAVEPLNQFFQSALDTIQCAG